LRRAVPTWGGFAPLLLLAVVLLRMAAHLPGVETPHAHGGIVHTHASGGFAHAHNVEATPGETTYPVRIAVRQRPSGAMLFHSDSAGHMHFAEERAPQQHEPTPPTDAPDSDRNERPDNYFCAASALVLASCGPELSIPSTPPLGVIIQCTAVKQRAVWRTKCTRGPPLALSVEIAFT
jgi:hypothetical protein